MKYEYDVALSFAGEQREYVREVAKALRDYYNLEVFFDEFEESKLWGKNLYDYLYDIYSKKAKYVIIFVSKAYAKKAWTNHEREAAQERALKEKREYILPVKFDDTDIPGLPQTVAYLDARKLSPLDIARRFAEKYGIAKVNRWWGYWERESYSDAVHGQLFIYKVTEDGFFFNLSVVHGAHMGEITNEFAKYIDKDKAIFKKESCNIDFIKTGDILQLQESNCNNYHGLRAYFDGIYKLQKDFFFIFDYMTDRVLTQIYSQLGRKFEDYKKCFSDYREEKESKKIIIYGEVPGMHGIYAGLLIIEADNVRGAYTDADGIAHWFATDNILDEKIVKWANAYKLKLEKI